MTTYSLICNRLQSSGVWFLDMQYLITWSPQGNGFSNLDKQGNHLQSDALSNATPTCNFRSKVWGQTILHIICSISILLHAYWKQNKCTLSLFTQGWKTIKDDSKFKIIWDPSRPNGIMGDLMVIYAIYLKYCMYHTTQKR